MTNDTTPQAEAAVDAAISAALTTVDSIKDAVTGAVEAVTGETSEPGEPKPPSFEDLGLHPDVLQAVADMGYFTPTPVQAAVFKPVSEGKDLMVQARTGTGKTTAFGLPMVNNIIPTHRQPQALILAPTRELALQVARELTSLGKHRGIVVEPIYGGAPIGKQITNLKNGVHIVVGTPGRVLDHIGRRTLDCKTISTFILDECDEMLSMGFLEDIERVVSHLPDKKQTLLFSATMPDEVARYSRRHMKAPETISLSRDSMTVSDIHHAYYIVSGIARSRDLLKIIYAEEPESAIIFCNMRDETTMVAKFLQKQGLDAEPLSSDLSQADRERVMGRMKKKNLRFLCATDVAARGIDISDLSHVINYSVPEQPEIYVHRTGRTGRAGKKGTALSLVGPRELGNFRYVRLTFGIKPEERMLPKDDIFVGKLKHPLPPVGTPQPPDPVQILIRGVTGDPSDLERQIFEKLLTSAGGKRVLAKLVAEKLDKLTTRARPKRERSERDHGEAAADGERGERSFDREDRPRRFDRDGERPRFRDRDGERTERFERGDRPERGGDRPERGGDRPERSERSAEGGERRERRPWRDREERNDRGDRPERSERRFDRDRGERGERGDRGERRDRENPALENADTLVSGAPAEERPRDRDRDRGDRGDRGPRDRDRGERRFDRDRDRGERRFDRDRDRPRAEDVPVADAAVDAPVVIEASAEAAAAPAVTEETKRDDRGERRFDRDRDRGERHRGDRDRDRGGRRDRDRDRGERREAEPAEASASEVGTEAAPAVETAPAEPTKVDEVARAVLERADRGGKSKKASGGETREFWETWAEEKSTRPAPEPAPAKAEASAEESEERPARGRDKGRGDKRERDRGGRDKRRTRDDKASDKASDAGDKKPAKADEAERPAGRTKRDTEISPAPASADAQAKLFVSLGKKHGVSADDLRELLAGPIGGDKARIGSVSLRDSHAHVRVPESVVDDIISAVHGTKHADQDVTVERSRA